MANLFQTILWVLLAVILWKAIRFFALRLRLLLRLSGLRKVRGANVRIPRPLSVFSPRVPARAFATITVGGICFAVRPIHGGGGFRWLHFASEEYAVCFSRMRARGVSPNKATTPAGSRSIALGGHVQILPKFSADGIEDLGRTEKTVPILLLSPCPATLTYVTEEKTSIRVAFNGDELYGQKVFSLPSFCKFIDRMSRENTQKQLFHDT